MYKSRVVFEKMKLNKIKVILDTKFNKNVFVVIELLKSLLYTVQGLWRLNREMGNIDKIQKTISCPNKMDRRLTTWIETKYYIRVELGILTYQEGTY